VSVILVVANASTNTSIEPTARGVKLRCARRPEIFMGSTGHTKIMRMDGIASAFTFSSPNDVVILFDKATP
jgi:hypothetical protein